MQDTDKTTVREFKVEDAEDLRKLADACQPLLVNGVYVNIFLAKYFGNSCFIMELEGKPIGFVSGFKSTTDPKIFFLWQLGLLPEFRGKGLSTPLIHRVFEAAKKLNCEKAQFSISPTIDSSFHAFSNYAKKKDRTMKVVEERKYSDPLSGKKGHEVFYEIEL